MRKKNLLFISIVSVLILGSCTNTMEEKPTPITFGSILGEIHETEVTSMAVDVGVTNAYKMRDGKNSIRNARMYVDVQYNWSSNPAKIYMKEDYEIIKFKVNGNEKDAEKVLDLESEQYIIENDSGATIYMKGIDDNWYCMNASIINEIEHVYMDDFFLKYNLLTEEQVQVSCEDTNLKINGRDTYQFVVKGTYSQTGELLKEIMESVLLKIEGISTDMEWTFRFYVDRETQEPISCIVELEDPLEFSQEEKNVWLQDFKIHIEYSKINQTTTVIIPDSVKKNAIKMNGNGFTR